MPAELVWTIPVSGDGRRARREEWNRGDWADDVPAVLPEWVRDDRGDKFDAFDHISAIVKAVEHSGFSAMLIPYDPGGDDSWIVAGSAARETRWTRTIVEFSPSVTTPVYAAKMAATFQRISGGRLDWKLVLEVDDDQAVAQGDFVRGDDRFARADEFLTVARSVWTQRDFDFDGRFYAVDAGGLGHPLNIDPFPRVFLSGSSPQALALGAKHADVHLIDSSSDEEIDHSVRVITGASQKIGREVQVGLQLPIIAREDADEAWVRVRRLLGERGHPSSESDVDALRQGRARWAGFDRLGFSSALGLVGSYDEVQVAIEAYLGRGIDVFVLDGFPHVEEAYRIGEHLISRLSGLALPAGTRVTV